MPGFRHIVLLDFGAASAEQVAAVITALEALHARLPVLRSYEVRRDAGLTEGNATVGVVADFDAPEDWMTYRDDAEHQRIIAELIRPILVGRSAVQVVR